MKTFEQWVDYFNYNLDKIEVVDIVSVNSFDERSLKDLVVYLQELVIKYGGGSIYSEDWYSYEDFTPTVKNIRLETDKEHSVRLQGIRKKYKKYTEDMTKQKESDRIKDEINALTAKLHKLQSK